jgi:hypothetical protein
VAEQSDQRLSSKLSRCLFADMRGYTLSLRLTLPKSISAFDPEGTGFQGELWLNDTDSRGRDYQS